MPDEETMGEYISKINSAAKRLGDAGFKIPELLVSFQTIRQLPVVYEGLVQILYRVDDNQFTPAKVPGSLISRTRPCRTPEAR